MPYYWFYVNNRELGYRVFFSDIKLFYYGVVDFFQHLTLNFNLNYSFINWSLDDADFLFSYRKSSIKNLIIRSLEHSFKN